MLTHEKIVLHLAALQAIKDSYNNEVVPSINDAGVQLQQAIISEDTPELRDVVSGFNDVIHSLKLTGQKVHDTMLLLFDNPLARPNPPTAGTAAPTVSFISPADGLSVTQISVVRGPTISLSASATPDTGRHIKEVRFRRNGSLIATATPLTSQNMALATAGGTITASSQHGNNWPASGAFNGDRKGLQWGLSATSNSGWNSAAGDLVPTLTRDFGVVRSIDEINLVMVQDNYPNPIEPTPSTTFTLYGLQDFDIQYKFGNSWVTVPNGSVRNNTFVWRQFLFAQPVVTDAIRVVISRTPDLYSRITEFEAISYSYQTTFNATEVDVPVGAQIYDATAIDDLNTSSSISSTHTVTVTPFFPEVVIEPPFPGTLRANFTEAQLKGGGGGTSVVKYLGLDSRDQMVADGWTNLPDAQQAAVWKFAEFKEFPQYPGVKFVRVRSGGWDAASNSIYPAVTISSWHWALPTWAKEIWFSYVINFTPSVAIGFAETGLKLPALGSFYGFDNIEFGGWSARTWCYPPNHATNPISYLGSTYEFYTGVQEGDFSHTWSGAFQEDVFHTVDFRVKMNTTNVPGSGTPADWNYDGHREVWLDNVLVRSDTDVRWSTSEIGNWIKEIFYNIFHGGNTPPTSPIEFWCGPVILSTVRAGKLVVGGSGGVQPPTPSTSGTHATSIVEANGSVWTLGAASGSDFKTMRDGVWVGTGLGVLYLYYNSLVYVKQSNGTWYLWSGSTSSWSSVGTADPSVTPSTDGTHATSITESNGTVWTLGTANGSDFQTMRNSVWVGSGLGSQYLYYGGSVYVKANSNGYWYKWTGSSWQQLSQADPSVVIIITPPGGNDPPAGNLAGLPSSPTGRAHIAVINALGNNQWANLGFATPDPVYGGRRGASWGPKMCYSAALGGAFIGGQGLHGFVAPTGRYDDIFFYDMYAHRWICIEPGIQTHTFLTDVQTGRIRMGPNNYLVYQGSSDHANGSPVYGVGAHSYQWPGYDADNQIFHPAGWPIGAGGDQWVQANPPAHNTHGNDYWYQEVYPEFDSRGWRALPRNYIGYGYKVSTGLWDRESGAAPFYFPSAAPKPGGWALFNSSGDPMGGTTYSAWGAFSGMANNPEMGGSYDYLACMDTLRWRIYMSYMAGATVSGGTLYYWDNATNTWGHPAANMGGGEYISSGNHSAMNYDSKADRIIIFRGWADYPYTKGVTTFNPGTSLFEGTVALGAGIPAGSSSSVLTTFYSRELNVHFCYLAGDSGVGDMWVYRYKV